MVDIPAVIKYPSGTFPESVLGFIGGIVDGVSNLSFVSEIELQVWTPENPDDFSVYKQFVTIGVGMSFVVTWGLQTAHQRKR